MAHKAVEMKRSERSDAEIQLSKQVVQTFLRGQAPCRLLRAASGPPRALRAEGDPVAEVLAYVYRLKKKRLA